MKWIAKLSVILLLVLVTSLSFGYTQPTDRQAEFQYEKRQVVQEIPLMQTDKFNNVISWYETMYDMAGVPFKNSVGGVIITSSFGTFFVSDGEVNAIDDNAEYSMNYTPNI